jgi:hypothetical protein
MLTVPTTSISSIPDLPDPGGSTGVCPHPALPLRTLITKGKSTAKASINEAIRPYPGFRPASKTP